MSTLLTFQRVITNTLRGAFLADAASMGTHWIYNPKEVMEKIAPPKEEPEFQTPPFPSFYSSTEFPHHYEAGMLSPYGEQLLFMTRYVAHTAAPDMTGQSMSTAMYEWATTFGGRPDHATLTFIENMKSNDPNKQYPHCGADDDQAHIYMKIVPIACRSINTPFPADVKTSGTDNRDKATDQHFLRKVAELIRVHQNNDIAVAFGIVSARILQTVISNAIVASPPPKTLLKILDDCYDAIPTDFAVIFDTSDAKMAANLKLVQDSYQRGKSAATEYKTLDDFLLELSHEKMKDQPDSPFYDFAARSCALPGSFIGPMYQLYKMASSSNVITGRNYMEAIRENIFAAGDTCSRGVFVGSVLGAAMTTVSPNSDKVDKMFEAAWMKVENETRREIVSYSKSIVEHSGTIHRLDADAEL